MIFGSLSRSDVVVYSAAIPKDDIEMQKAHSLHIPTIERADFLGIITKAFNETICVSGTHGKSTTVLPPTYVTVVTCTHPAPCLVSSDVLITLTKANTWLP